MNFNNYKQGPLKYPLLQEVATEYLVRPNGKPTLLTYLLKDLGCTVHTGSVEHGTTPVIHDEALLAPIVERVIEDYIRYHNHHAGHDDVMRDDVSHFMDPSDFLPESGDLKPVSISDIERFMTDIVAIRIEKGEELKKGNPELQARINALCRSLGDMITEIHLASAGKKCQDIADTIRREVHGVTGFAGFSQQMNTLRREMYQKGWSKIDSKKPIQNENILHLFTTLRALARLRNKEAGINTGDKLRELEERRRKGDADLKTKIIPIDKAA